MAFDSSRRPRRCFEDIDVNLGGGNNDDQMQVNKKRKKARTALFAAAGDDVVDLTNDDEMMKIYTFSLNTTTDDDDDDDDDEEDEDEDNNNRAHRRRNKSKKRKKNNGPEVEVVSFNSVYDLVDILLRVCNPRKNGDTADCHLWNLWINNKVKMKSIHAKETRLSSISKELFLASDNEVQDKDSGCCQPTTTFMTLEYGYGSKTTYHDIILRSIQDVTPKHNHFLRIFPREKPKRKRSTKPQQQPSTIVPRTKNIHPTSNPLPAPPSATATATAAAALQPSSTQQMETHMAPTQTTKPQIRINLNEMFPSLNRWCFERTMAGGIQIKELNFFQAGCNKAKKHVYGYMETNDQQMIFVPQQANNLLHYLQCLNKATATPRGKVYSWHSIVVIPINKPKNKKNNSNSNETVALPKRLKPYQEDLEEGFCDCHLVEEESETTTGITNYDLTSMFPNIAAFAGFPTTTTMSRSSSKGKKKIKPKTIKRRGWIRYKDRVLLICTGDGSPVLHPKSPKGTAFHGEGPHIPANPSTDVLFGIRKNFSSLQELFCEVEQMLSTIAEKDAEKDAAKEKRKD